MPEDTSPVSMANSGVVAATAEHARESSDQLVGYRSRRPAMPTGSARARVATSGVADPAERTEARFAWLSVGFGAWIICPLPI